MFMVVTHFTLLCLLKDDNDYKCRNNIEFLNTSRNNICSKAVLKIILLWTVNLSSSASAFHYKMRIQDEDCLNTKKNIPLCVSLIRCETTKSE